MSHSSATADAPPRPALRRVLICDDDRRARHALRAMLDLSPELEISGEAADGDEILRIARACHPDVILMDVRMPRMDGFTATRLIKAECPATRVIILTMYADEQARAENSGVDGFLLKGCAADQILEAILR